LSFLNDDYKLSTIVKVSFPENAFSSPGDGGFVTQLVDVDDLKNASIMFSYEDSFNSPTKGYHYMQFRVNGKVMWEEDVAGSDVGGRVSIDLSKVTNKGEPLELSFGVFEEKGVSNFNFNARFYDVKTTGLKMQALSADEKGLWRRDIKGSFSVEFQPFSVGTGRFHLPMIVMPAGSQEQFKKRYDQGNTPQNILAKV